MLCYVMLCYVMLCDLQQPWTQLRRREARCTVSLGEQQASQAPAARTSQQRAASERAVPAQPAAGIKRGLSQRCRRMQRASREGCPRGVDGSGARHAPAHRASRPDLPSQAAVHTVTAVSGGHWATGTGHWAHVAVSHWSPRTGLRALVSGHWSPGTGLRALVSGHWSPGTGLRALVSCGELGGV
jgi:hypothetical protein